MPCKCVAEHLCWVDARDRASREVDLNHRVKLWLLSTRRHLLRRHLLWGHVFGQHMSYTYAVGRVLP
jgi:hypothetical protein